MRPEGEQTAQAIIAWFTDEIKNSSATIADLGRFFFGASSAAIGLLVTLATLGEKLTINLQLCLSLALFSLSLLVSIFMVTPRVWLVTGDTDLIQEYRITVERGKAQIRQWFLCWLLGSAFAILFLFARSQSGSS